MKIRIDGVEYEVSEQVAQAIEKERGAAAEKLATETKRADTAEAKATEQTKRADAAEGKLTETTKALTEATDQKRIDAAVTARIALVDSSRKILGADFKFDGLTDRQIREAVIRKDHGKAEEKFDGVSDDFLAGQYAAIVAKAPASTTHVHESRKDIEGNCGGEGIGVQTGKVPAYQQTKPWTMPLAASKGK